MPNPTTNEQWQAADRLVDSILAGEKPLGAATESALRHAVAEEIAAAEARGYNLANEAAAAQRELDDALVLTRAELSRIEAALRRTHGAPVNLLSTGLRRHPIDTGNLLATILEELADNSAGMNARLQRAQGAATALQDQRQQVRHYLGSLLADSLGVTPPTETAAPATARLTDEQASHEAGQLINMWLSTGSERTLLAAGDYERLRALFAGELVRRTGPAAEA